MEDKKRDEPETDEELSVEDLDADETAAESVKGGMAAGSHDAMKRSID